MSTLPMLGSAYSTFFNEPELAPVFRHGSLKFQSQRLHIVTGTNAPDRVFSCIDEYGSYSNMVYTNVGFDNTRMIHAMTPTGTAAAIIFDKLKGNTVNFHFRKGTDEVSGQPGMINPYQVVDASGNVLCAIQKTSSLSSAWYAKLYGTSEQTSGVIAELNGVGYDFELTYDPLGACTFKVYQNGNLVANLSSTSIYDKPSQIEMRPRYFSYTRHIVLSEMMLSFSKSLVGNRLIEIEPLASGSLLENPGDVSLLKTPVGATGIVCSMINGRTTWVPNVSGKTSSGNVCGVFMKWLATRISGEPTRVTNLLRVDDVNLYGNCEIATGDWWSDRWLVDPRTNLPFTLSQLYAAEYGFRVNY